MCLHLCPLWFLYLEVYLFAFPVNVYLFFCVPYGLVPDLNIMGWELMTLHDSTLFQETYIHSWTHKCDT